MGRHLLSGLHCGGASRHEAMASVGIAPIAAFTLIEYPQKLPFKGVTRSYRSTAFR